MNKDSHLIFEKYQEQVNEGILDRLKSRGASAVGTVRGAGQRVAGAAKGAVAGIKGDVAGVKAGQRLQSAGKIQGDLAKIESYRNTAMQKISKLTNEIFSDIKKLGIELGNVTQASQTALPTALNNAFNDIINDIKEKAGIIPPGVAPTAPATTTTTPTAPATPTTPAAPAAPTA